MDLSDAFDKLQGAADADRAQVKEARRRRDLFRDAFKNESDVDEVVPSGSLARSTQREPINDVDVIIVFEPTEHPDWGSEGDSAGDALDYTRGRVKELLGDEVRLAKPRNHAVKCFLDDPDDPNAFTVDVMPALRQPGGHLLVPEQENKKWVPTDPEFLIRRVAERQDEWDRFRALVRVLRFWNDKQGGKMKSLLIEVLALDHLPANETRPQALRRFFEAAHKALDRPVEDPAGHCGEIQPDLDTVKAKKQLDEAASHAWKAVNAQDAGENDRAACHWRRVFGDDFPEPEGGCSDDDDSGSAAAFNIGTGATGGAIGIDRPRPVTDVPQG